jgi:hypothetical protein
VKGLYLPPLLCLALAAAGCISAGRDIDFNPLYRSYALDRNGSVETDSAIPFLYSRESADYWEWGFRPLWSYRHDESRARKEFDFLIFLGRYLADEHGSRFRIWPLYWYEKYYHEEGEDVDWIFFPLLWGGHSHDGENYFAFFPLGGRIRHFMSFDTFDFFLWPLYMRSKKSVSEESITTSILILFSWTKGGVRDHSFQALPFYMRRLWEGKYRKYSILWPFFHYQENQLDTKHPATLYAFWPLITHEGSDIHYRLGLIGPLLFLGPLIQAASETPEEWNGEPNVEGRSYYLYDVPWPLVRIEKNREFERFRIFPLYSHFEQEGFDSKAFLIPIIWRRKEWNDRFARKDFLIVPLFHHIRKEYTEAYGLEKYGSPTASDAYLQVWPLFHRSRKADGSLEFSFLSILPLRTKRIIEAFERALWPFYNIYRYQRKPWGASRHTALFGLFSTYSDAYESRVSLPLIYNGHSSSLEGWEHNFILNLISIGGDEEGLKKIRILFIPFLDS